MVDLQALRSKIAEKASPNEVTTVSRRWLEEVERDLSQLAALKAAEEPRNASHA